MKLGCSSAMCPPHPTTKEKFSPAATKTQRLLSEGHRGVLHKIWQENEANIPVVLGEEGDERGREGEGAGLEQPPQFTGTRKAQGSLTFQAVNTQLLCAPALAGTRFLLLQEPRSAGQTRPKHKHRSWGRAGTSAAPFPHSQVIFWSLSPCSGISPSSPHGSSPAGQLLPVPPLPGGS